MATTYSNNLRVAKQERPDNQNTWGAVLSDNTIQMLIEAITDIQSIDVAAGNVTLTTNDGTTDQARAMGLKFTGAPGVTRVVTAPSVSKFYIVWNASDATVQLKTSAGTAVDIAAGDKEMVFTDGTDFYALTYYQPGGTDVAVADGGTGSSTAAGARTNLGLVIGTDVQAYDAGLNDIAGLAVTDGNFIVGNGTNWVAETGATVRTSLGLGSLATLSTINDANWSGTDLTVANGGTGASTLTGIVKGNGTAAFSAATAGTDYYAPGSTDVAVADGGTGSSTAAGARTNLGLVIGTDVQAYDTGLNDIAGLAVTDGNFIVGNGLNWVVESGATVRTSLGLGSLATLSTINNDNWSGTDLAVANGGTGASTATAALNNMLPTQTGNSGEFLTTDGTNASWATVPSGVTDHGALTGLADDDHTQYALVDGTRAFTGTVTGTALRLTAITDATLASTGHALQIGSTASNNLAFDTEGIEARNNGASDKLWLNFQSGGTVDCGGSLIVGDDLTIVDNLVVGNGIGGAGVSAFFTATAVLDPPSTATSTRSSVGTITVTGAVRGDAVIINQVDGATAVSQEYTGEVTAANTVTVYFTNHSNASSIDPASQTIRAVVIQMV